MGKKRGFQFVASLPEGEEVAELQPYREALIVLSKSGRLFMLANGKLEEVLAPSGPVTCMVEVVRRV